MQVVEAEKKNFLGQEFLTWLWFHGEENDWTLQFSDHDHVDYDIENEEKGLLVMEPDNTQNSCIQKLQGVNPRTCNEATEGLKSGKKVSIAKMWVSYQNSEWTFTCRGEKLAVSGLALCLPSSNTPRERFYELAENLEKFSEVWDKMFASFLKIRLSPEWEESELPNMRAWIQNRP